MYNIMFDNVRQNGKKLDNIVLLLYAISLFCNSYFLFTWETYPVKMATFIFKGLYYIAPFLLLLVRVWHSDWKFSLEKKYLFALIVLSMFFVHVNFFGYTSKTYLNPGHLFVLLQVILLISLKDGDKIIFFENIIKIFIIMTLPSLLFFVLDLIGIDCSIGIIYSSHVGKAQAGVYYLHYPFGLVMRGEESIPRLCGLFDEPGVVGTLAALLFSASYGKIAKKWSNLLFVIGFFSFSMAFYLLIIFFFLIEFIRRKSFKLFGVITCICVILFLLTNYNFSNQYISLIQRRIDLASFFLVHDNRTGDSFNLIFDDFLNSGGYPLFFGNGNGAAEDSVMMFGSSYKTLVYNCGILGVFLFILFIYLCYKKIGNEKALPFVAVFLVSIYQRPFVFSAQYLAILILGIFYASGFKSKD